MRYLIFSCDYDGPFVQDEFEGPINLSKLELPKDFIEELISWNDRYKTIIPLSIEERDARRSEIESLDEQGLLLAKKLEKVIKEGAKVKYFSEGKLMYIFPNRDIKN